jgi:hypothetical protein
MISSNRQWRWWHLHKPALCSMQLNASPALLNVLLPVLSLFGPTRRSKGLVTCRADKSCCYGVCQARLHQVQQVQPHVPGRDRRHLRQHPYVDRHGEPFGASEVPLQFPRTMGGVGSTYYVNYKAPIALACQGTTLVRSVFKMVAQPQEKMTCRGFGLSPDSDADAASLVRCLLELPTTGQCDRAGPGWKGGQVLALPGLPRHTGHPWVPQCAGCLVQ